MSRHVSWVDFKFQNWSEGAAFCVQRTVSAPHCFKACHSSLWLCLVFCLPLPSRAAFVRAVTSELLPPVGTYTWITSSPSAGSSWFPMSWIFIDSEPFLWDVVIGVFSSEELQASCAEPLRLQRLRGDPQQPTSSPASHGGLGTPRLASRGQFWNSLLSRSKSQLLAWYAQLPLIRSFRVDPKKVSKNFI